jgi:hypothetical protein
MRTHLTNDTGAFRRIALGIGVGVLAASCSKGASTRNGGDSAVSRAPIEDVQNAHTDAWMKIPGVVGTAIGLCDEQPCIKVLVVRSTPELRKAIPDSTQGYRVIIEETGTIRAQDSSRS